MDEPGNDLTAFVLGGLVALVTLVGYLYYEDRSSQSEAIAGMTRAQLTIDRPDR